MRSKPVTLVKENQEKHVQKEYVNSYTNLKKKKNHKEMTVRVILQGPYLTYKGLDEVGSR